MPIRTDFPTAETALSFGGESNGLVFRTIFAGSTIQGSLEMIKAFLIEEGYVDVPLPVDAKELECFRLSTRNKQILMFEDNGYVHNPVKILFPADRRKKNALVLELYNEEAEKHLLRFHGRLNGE